MCELHINNNYENEFWKTKKEYLFLWVNLLYKMLFKLLFIYITHIHIYEKYLSFTINIHTSNIYIYILAI